MLKSKEELIQGVEVIALEMEKSMDSLIISIEKHDKYRKENQNRLDEKEIDDELRKSEILTRCQNKIDRLSKLF